jgi:hypothetical protein
MSKRNGSHSVKQAYNLQKKFMCFCMRVFCRKWLHAEILGFENVLTGNWISAIRCGLLCRNDRAVDAVTFYQMVVSPIHETGRGEEMESGAMRDKRE